MNVAVKVTLFVVALVAVFGTAAALGNVVGPVGTSTSETTMAHGEDSEAGMAGMDMAVSEHPGGLQIAENGYRLELDEPSRNPDRSAEVSFRIIGPDGMPVVDYALLHDKRLHLIVAKRDLSGFQHVHPTLGTDGTWTATVSLTSGQWRVFADFDPAGKDKQITLGADVSVVGDFEPLPLPAPSRTAEVDGYTVTLAGHPEVGAQSKLTLEVSKDGRPVTDLQPYLAAYGHLVALREGDLAYLHVHPDGEPGDGRTKAGPGITFYAEFPSAGRYRLYLDFKHGGTVRTAEFTIAPATTGSDAAPETAEPAEHTDEEADGH